MIGVVLFCIIMCWRTYTIYKKKKVSPSTLLYSLYAISGISSVVLIYIYNYNINPLIDDYFSGFVFLSIALLIYLYPFYKVNDHNFESFSIPTFNILNIIVNILTFISLFSLLYFLPISVKMLTTNIADVANLRNAVAAGENPYISQTIFNTIAGTGASFYSLQILFFFTLVSIKKRLTMQSELVLLSSLSYPVFVLAYMGRDGVLFWCFNFIFFFFLFRRFIPRTINKKLLSIFTHISIIMAILFLFITIGRFLVVEREDSSYGVFYPFFNYLGQSPIYFTEYFSTGLKKMDYGASMFPLLFGEQTNENEVPLYNFGLVPWVFRTFILSIYSSFGATLTLAIGIIFNIIYEIFNKYNKYCFSFSYLILYTLFITVYSQGVFYFRHYNMVGNLYIVVMLSFAVIALFLPKVKCTIEKK